MLKEGPRPQISQVSAGTGVPQLGSLHHILCVPCGQHFGDAPAWPWAGAAGKEGRDGGGLWLFAPLQSIMRGGKMLTSGFPLLLALSFPPGAFLTIPCAANKMS